MNHLTDESIRKLELKESSRGYNTEDFVSSVPNLCVSLWIKCTCIKVEPGKCGMPNVLIIRTPHHTYLVTNTYQKQHAFTLVPRLKPQPTYPMFPQ